MIKNIEINIEQEVYDSVESIVEDLGFDVEIVTKMLIKKIYKEKSINFLLKSNFPESKEIVNIENRLRKSTAIAMFCNEGINLKGKTITFASKNKSANNYWSNPYDYYFENEWFLILNDQFNKKIFLFKIEGGVIDSKNELVARADMTDVIDLQISYEDPTFTDTRSKYSFKKFLIKEISYN